MNIRDKKGYSNPSFVIFSLIASLMKVFFLMVLLLSNTSESSGSNLRLIGFWQISFLGLPAPSLFPPRLFIISLMVFKFYAKLAQIYCIYIIQMLNNQKLGKI